MNSRDENEAYFFIARHGDFVRMLVTEATMLWPGQTIEDFDRAGNSINLDGQKAETAREAMAQIRIAFYGAMTKMYGPPEHSEMIPYLADGTEFIWNLFRLWPDVGTEKISQVAAETLQMFREIRQITGENPTTLPLYDEEYQTAINARMTNEFGPQRVKE